MASKTREKLIEVARQLFARQGLAHTTMNDIAAASEKGRRTIYTYFKSKREIYNAVIERESDRHVEKMREVAEDMTLSPGDQLYQFMLTRYKSAADPTGRSLLSKLTLDAKRTERIRKMTYNKELLLLDKILLRGLNEGGFNRPQTERLKAFMRRWLMSVDWTSHPDTMQLLASGISKEDFDRSHLALIEFIIEGTLNKNTIQ